MYMMASFARKHGKLDEMEMVTVCVLVGTEIDVKNTHRVSEFLATRVSEFELMAEYLCMASKNYIRFYVK